MIGSESGTLVERAPVLSEEGEMRLSLPETTMFIVASSGALWALLYGAFNVLFG